MPPDSRRTAAAVALVVLWAAGSAPSALAGQAQSLDQGTYLLRVEGRRVGTEAFAIRREGRDIKAVGRVSLDTTTTLTPLEVWLQTDTEYRPDLFRLRPGAGDLRAVTAVREERRLRLQISTKAGDRFKEFMAPPELSVLEPHIAHHYLLVLRQHRGPLAADGTARIPVVVPSRSDRFTLVLRRDGEEQIQVPAGSRSAIRYRLTLDGDEIRVWADAEGRVLRLEVPSRDLVAVRSGEER